MLILNTPDGDFAIAKGNIHTIQEDYDVGYYLLRRKAPTSRKAWDERSES